MNICKKNICKYNYFILGFSSFFCNLQMNWDFNLNQKFSYILEKKFSNRIVLCQELFSKIENPEDEENKKKEENLEKEKKSENEIDSEDTESESDDDDEDGRGGILLPILNFFR